MQVRTEKHQLSIGDHHQPSITVALAPRSSSGYLFAGIGIGVLIGFVLGSALTLLVGNKSMLLVQHLWTRLTGSAEEGEHVHFELLLQ